MSYVPPHRRSTTYYLSRETSARSAFGECAICRETIPLDHKELTCFHHFCRPCINIWVKKKLNPTCPLCRKPISLDMFLPPYEYGIF